MIATTTAIGYLASTLVLMTFATNDLHRLRVIAILSNLAFIAYGGLAWLPPVLGLHLLLLPLNVVRLIEFTKATPERNSPHGDGFFAAVRLMVLSIHRVTQVPRGAIWLSASTGRVASPVNKI